MDDSNKNITICSNAMLAEVNNSAVGTSLEPWIGWKFPVIKKSKNRIWVERDYGCKKVVKYDRSLFDCH